MKRSEIKVGSDKRSFDLTYNRPENVADCLGLVDGNELALAGLFNRGFTIWLQDRLGRPMFQAGATAVQIQDAIDAAVPGKTKGVSKARQPIVVEVKKGHTYTAAEVAALLAAKGVKTVTE